MIETGGRGKDQMRDWLVKRYPLEKSESPMESLFYAGYRTYRAIAAFEVPALRMKPQEAVGAYRADFMYRFPGADGKEARLVVEVDGHDFHERTKEQAAKDKARDRWMTGAGYHVMRFTGSEVWANPIGCGEQVTERIYMLHYGMSRRESIAAAGLASITALFD